MRKAILTVCCFLSIVVVVDRGVGAFLKTGLKRYFGLSKPANVLCVGHSRTVLGVDPKKLSQGLGVPVAKYGMDGVNIFDRCAMVRHFLARQPGVRVLLFDVESTSFTDSQLSSNSYRLFLPFIDEPEFANLVRSQCPSVLEFWLYRLLTTARYDEATVNRSVRGWFGYDENLKHGQVNLELLRARTASGRIRPVKIEPASYAAFVELISELSERGVHIVLWHPPTIDILDDVDRTDRERVRQHFREIAAANERVSYLEYVQDYRSQHDLFYDGIHMNGKGKSVVTDRLILDIRRLGVIASHE